MKLNRLGAGFLVLALATTAIAFAVSSNTEEMIETLKPKVVRTEEVAYSKEAYYLEYMGIVEADKTINVSFSQGGTLESTYVSKGAYVQKGQLLAVLDAEAMTLVNQASSAQTNAAQSSLSKASEALAYSESNYNNRMKLYEAGAISKDQFDQVSLDYQLRQQDYTAALEVVNQAKANNGLSRKQLEEASVYADMDGFVVDVLYEPGETIAAGYPVVILRSVRNTLNVGVSQKDIQQLEVGSLTRVLYDHAEMEGEIVDISQVPDPQTRTYLVEVLLPDVNIPLGAVAKAQFFNGEREGIKVPVNAIMNFNTDYVYTVVDGVVVKKNVEIQGLNELDAYVNGLRDGDVVIVEGHKRVQENDQVMMMD